MVLNLHHSDIFLCTYPFPQLNMYWDLSSQQEFTKLIPTFKFIFTVEIFYAN